MGIQQETVAEEAVSRWELLEWDAAEGVLLRRDVTFRQLGGQLSAELSDFFAALFEIAETNVDLPASLWWKANVFSDGQCLNFYFYIFHVCSNI